MKNIHNLITDAFDAANIVESDYNIDIEDTYTIIITKKELDMPNCAFYIYMEMDLDTLRKVDYDNTLITVDQFIAFKNVLNSQIIPFEGEENLNNPNINVYDNSRLIVSSNLLPVNTPYTSLPIYHNSFNRFISAGYILNNNDINTPYVYNINNTPRINIDNPGNLYINTTLNQPDNWD